ncbi:hypothetical protein CHM34_05105 [Paludifilum halophilum]|uniref:Alpha/beta hydrolase n=2 Tax=Paludifilum halophilum TaxID=1642702 RepID=A0A235BAA2_9BACL|nr:hypothetical protein CHM34_05105 [Paludifilum halophilum]
MERLKQQVISRQTGSPSQSPEQMKMEMAQQAGVPYKPGYNGDLKTEEAGKMGGPVGGQMVKDLIQIAEEELVRRQSRP